MKNYQCLYVKKIFIGIIYALECKLNPCSNGILKYVYDCVKLSDDLGKS